MPFYEGQGKVAKDVGPNRFEAELHKSAKFTAKGKVERAIEFKKPLCRGRRTIYTSNI